MAHDFKQFPELTDNQMQFYYFESPHKQITGDFRAKVIKVTDGDTIRIRADFRNFDFPVRVFNLEAPEMNEKGGKESQSWLESQILGEEVEILLSDSRVEKWGRLLADIMHKGIIISEESVRMGHGLPWEQRAELHPIPNFEGQLKEITNDITI